VVFGCVGVGWCVVGLCCFGGLVGGCVFWLVCLGLVGFCVFVVWVGVVLGWVV
jgi:hypothetical protein